MDAYKKLSDLAGQVDTWMIDDKHRPKAKPIENLVYLGEVIDYYRHEGAGYDGYYPVATFSFKNETYIRAGCRTLSLDRAYIHWTQASRFAEEGTSARDRAFNMLELIKKAERIAHKNGWKHTPALAGYYPLFREPVARR